MRPAARRPARERGFVLMGVVWLLLLGAALVAVLLLRSKGDATAASLEGRSLQAELDRRAAVETIAADVLVNGPRSPWSSLPAEGTVRIGARTIPVRLDAEADRLDINGGDPAIVTSALQAAGYAPSSRQVFLASLGQARAAGRIESFARMAAMLQVFDQEDAATADRTCAENLFTITGSGGPPTNITVPQGILGTPDQRDAARRPIRIGEALRARIGAGGSSFAIIFRIAASTNQPVSIIGGTWTDC